jgi:hypothetical protein
MEVKKLADLKLQEQIKKDREEKEELERLERESNPQSVAESIPYEIKENGVSKIEEIQVESQSVRKYLSVQKDTAIIISMSHQRGRNCKTRTTLEPKQRGLTVCEVQKKKILGF